MICLLRVGFDDAAEPDDAEVAPVTERFGNYRIEHRDDGTPWELGRGAMGVTYRAIDTSLQRPVALKLIDSEWVKRGAEARERFMREARAAAALRHPNVAAVHHFGIREENGQCFCAMELIEGETLEMRVRRTGPLYALMTVEIALQVSSALSAAEKQGLVHRDLKPANLMFVDAEPDTNGAKPAEAEDVVVKVIDFGVAKALAEKPDAMGLTHGGFVGTPAFASPEQFTNAPVDVRSDIYSLGATLWYLLTGHMPFAGASVEQIRASQHSHALPLEQLKAARVPRRLISLVVSMLALEPAARPGIRQLTVQLESLRTHLTNRGQPLRRLGMAALFFALVTGAMLFLPHPFGNRNWQRNPTAVANTPKKSIAVLPFENLSEEKTNAFFADGIQDEILTNLARIADLKVISRTSVMQYKTGAERNLREVGKQLGVAHVLEGSVQRVASRARVSVQLIDARTDTHLWAQTYDRDLADVFAIQSEIARTIAEQLQVRLSATEKAAIQQRPTANLAAFDLYTRARTSPDTRGISKNNLLQAIELLNQAVARDPEFILAWCDLTVKHDLLYFLGGDHTPARLALAEAAVQTALRLRPDAGEAHLAFANHLYQGYLDYDRARAELAIAQRTLPNEPSLFNHLGNIDRRQGRWAESTRNLERASELDPLNFNQNLSWNYEALRRYAEMAAVLDRSLLIAPKDVEARVDRALVELNARANPRPLHTTIEAILAEDPATAATLASDWLDLALSERDPAFVDRAVLALADNPYPLGGISLNRAFVEGLVARVSGDADAAHAAFTRARIQQEEVTRAQPDYAPALGSLGLIDAALGRKEEALREGRRAIELLPVARDSLGGADMIQCFAIICAWTGEKDLALEQLTIATQIPGDLSYGQLKLHPFFDPLRDDPRFDKIVASLAPKEAGFPDKSIAVLPFENLSDDQANVYFALGIQDDILVNLSRIRDLKVISRTSVMQYKSGSARNLREIGKELGVAHLLEGSVQRSGGKVRVHAQLIDARNDAHLWANTYDRDLADVFSIQSEIARTIAEQLQATLSPVEMAAMEKPATKDLAAHELYIRAKTLISTPSPSGGDKHNLLQVAQLLDQAVARDPSFLPAYCQLAFAHDRLYQIGFDRTASRLASAQAAVQTALQLGPATGEAHLAYAWHHYLAYRDYERARAELGIARQTLPNHSGVFALAGYIDRRQGRQEEGLRSLQQALDLDPRNLALMAQLSNSYASLRRYVDQAAVLERALAINPKEIDTRLTRAAVDLNWRAETRPLRTTIQSILAENPGAAKSVADSWTGLALCERDASATERALAAFEQNAWGENAYFSNYVFGEGLLARMTDDKVRAHAAFAAARAKQVKVVEAQPDYAPAIALLGLIDAGLGRKEDALREGRRAVELLPVAKDYDAGTEMIKYLAIIAAWIDERDLALEQLTIASHLPAGLRYGELKLHPFWDPLRGDPRFEKIVASLAPKKATDNASTGN